ncbi:Smr/MutS family protein [Stappia sp.]|uniref:Smr/MutS family protein n=1 Tax=Stappia sp. TaxID=1870903 RepID=UPI003D0A7235
MSSGRRKGRQPSPDERRLWAQVTADVEPLVRPRRAPAEGEAVSEPGGAPDAGKERPAAALAVPPPTVTALRKPSAPPLSPLEPRQRRKVARGIRAIDARIDLHGLTQAEAHVRLRGFLTRAQSQGATLVLVITGKGGAGGSPAAEGRGILRRVVPQWLSFPEFRALVVGYEQAHATHGGDGALYVRIRRAGRWGTP